MIVDQVNVAFHKLAGLSVVSNELIADSSPEASALVGEGLARDIARKLDDAFFRDGATLANSPAGLGAQSGVAAVDAGAAFTNLDPFEAAISKVALKRSEFINWYGRFSSQSKKNRIVIKI